MHPNSLANLEKSPHSGRPAKWGDRKKREVLVSAEGWEGAQAAAKAAGCTGISELLEKLGRGMIALSPVSEAGDDPVS